MPLDSGDIFGGDDLGELFREKFPHLSTLAKSYPRRSYANDVILLADVEYSTNLDWHQTPWHPQSRYFDELRARYKREHPQVSQVTGKSGVEPVGASQEQSTDVAANNTPPADLPGVDDSDREESNAIPLSEDGAVACVPPAA